MDIHKLDQMIPFNPRNDGGGRISAPPEGFVDNGKNAARGAAKFGITIPLFFLHSMCKL